MQFEQKGDRDEDASPRRAPRNRRDSERDENRQADVRDERPARRHAYRAKYGHIVEKESVERRVQPERSDEPEEDPGPDLHHLAQRHRRHDIGVGQAGRDQELGALDEVDDLGGGDAQRHAQQDHEGTHPQHARRLA